MDDLTILYISASQMPEQWMKFQIGHLLRAIGDTPIISVTRKPLNLGTNLIDEEPISYWNIYMQMLRASLLATTSYVAMAEDDTLYTKEHFTEFRPPIHSVSYDRARWSLFTWDIMYCMRQRVSNCSLIAPRELLIEALMERKLKWPKGRENEAVGEVGRPIIERKLQISHVEMVEWYCKNPIVMLNHPTGTDSGVYPVRPDGRKMVKKHGQMKAYDIPYWGKATDIIKVYNG